MSISVVINTLNEEKNLPRALKSVEGWADEVVVVDMKSDDRTDEIAKKAGVKIYEHKRTNYVEPARNFAISKTKGDWVMILDADEEMTEELKKALLRVVKEGKYDFVRLPRKNLIYGKWMQYSRWWPDYNVRFFKKGKVAWDEAIHSVPMTEGKGFDIPPEEKLAIVHHHYDSISQFVQRMDRYTDQQLRILHDRGYVFEWQDLITKPVNEFLSRYFAGVGYKDGLHGLAMALLQGFSESVLYLKAWESGGFKEEDISVKNFRKVMTHNLKDVLWWVADMYKREGNTLQRALWRLKRLVVKI